MTKIGIIGCGFVGSAVAAGFAQKADIKIYDKLKEGYDTIADVCQQNIIFVCVPTPMRKTDNLPELSFVIDALRAIQSEISQQPDPSAKIVVIKSTVLPGTCRELQRMFPDFHIVVNPEFLTARTARLDFINTARVILGAENQNALEVVIAAYRTILPHTHIYLCRWEEAELLKYMSNCFFALKISFLNEIFMICKRLGADYNLIKKAWLADGRIGNSHHDVPGHDGDVGFGGACFPKDVAAFVKWGELNNLPVETIAAAQRLNNRIRVKRDWDVFDDEKARAEMQAAQQQAQIPPAERPQAGDVEVLAPPPEETERPAPEKVPGEGQTK